MTKMNLRVSRVTKSTHHWLRPITKVLVCRQNRYVSIMFTRAYVSVTMFLLPNVCLNFPEILCYPNPARCFIMSRYECSAKTNKSSLYVYNQTQELLC